MNKYWYVVHNGTEYLIGFCYGEPRQDDEKAIMSCMEEYCDRKKYRLAMLVQVFPMLPIVNQIYPVEPTEESRYCFECALQAIEQA